MEQLLAFALLLFVSHSCSVGVYVASRFKHFEEFDKNPEMFRNDKIEDKMILWWVRYYGSYLPEFWQKPVFLCLACMGSLWSLGPSILYCYLYTGIHTLWIVWPLATLVTCGINSKAALNLKWK